MSQVDANNVKVVQPRPTPSAVVVVYLVKSHRLSGRCAAAPFTKSPEAFGSAGYAGLCEASKTNTGVNSRCMTGRSPIQHSMRNKNTDARGQQNDERVAWLPTRTVTPLMLKRHEDARTPRKPRLAAPPDSSLIHRYGRQYQGLLTRKGIRTFRQMTVGTSVDTFGGMNNTPPRIDRQRSSRSNAA